MDVELTAQVDWEVELGVIVGHGMRSVAVGAALDYVFGYPVGNDVSARDVQFSERQWTRGRTFAPSRSATLWNARSNASGCCETA